MIKKKKIVLFQPYLRKHILSFGRYLHDFEFVVKKPVTSGSFYKSLPPTFDQEINRIKINKINQIRRFFGILNVRIKFDTEADILFTYGCMLLTNKPYCIYIENGVAIYNYDTAIAANPLARLLFSFLIRQSNCKKIIFMSQAGQKSFFSTVPYGATTRAIAESKSVQIYPLVEKKVITPKKYNGSIKLLFSGVFYMKGGLELVQAFSRLRKKYDTITLTVITPFQTLRESDKILMQKHIPGLTLLDANLDEAQMNEMYRNHDLFMLPTFRDGFGLVLVEAISWGMPIICTNQYATTEVAIDGHNAFVCQNHPLKDYDIKTFRLFGKYYHPKNFYRDLFRFQKEGTLKPIEDFIYHSVEKFLLDTRLLEKFSISSLEVYDKTFHQDIITKKIESVFHYSLKK